MEEDGEEARIVDGVQAQVWGVARVKCSGGVLLWVLVECGGSVSKAD